MEIMPEDRNAGLRAGRDEAWVLGNVKLGLPVISLTAGLHSADSSLNGRGGFGK